MKDCSIIEFEGFFFVETSNTEWNTYGQTKFRIGRTRNNLYEGDYVLLCKYGSVDEWQVVIKHSAKHLFFKQDEAFHCLVTHCNSLARKDFLDNITEEVISYVWGNLRSR